MRLTEDGCAPIFDVITSLRSSAAAHFHFLDQKLDDMKWFMLLICILKGEAFIRFGKKAQEKYGLQSYMVQINIRDTPSGNTRKSCGGTLLTNQVIYTACHCFHDDKMNALNFGGEVQLYAYETFHEGPTDTSKPRHQQEKYTFKSYYIPGSQCVNPQLNPDVDYALVFLDKPLDFDALGNDMICSTEHSPVIPMLAHRQKIDFTEILTKGPCFLAGYGLEESADPSDGIKPLKYTWVESVKNVENKTLDVTFQIHGDKRSGACRGDSGSSLICIHNDMPYTMGVVSGGQVSDANLKAQIAKMNPSLPAAVVDCLARSETTWFNSLNPQWSQIENVIAEKFKGSTDETGTLGYWQKVCAQYYKDWGYVGKYRRDDEELINEGCFFCSAVHTLSLVAFALPIIIRLF